MKNLTHKFFLILLIFGCFLINIPLAHSNLENESIPTNLDLDREETIRGKVVESDTDDPLIGASVSETDSMMMRVFCSRGLLS